MEGVQTQASIKFQEELSTFLKAQLGIEEHNAQKVVQQFITNQKKFITKTNLDDLNDFSKAMNMFDLLKYNNINLDLLTETFYTSFYGTYLSKWPEYCVLAENSISMYQGYLIGKVEGDKGNEVKKDWHGHVSAVTVAPQFRRQGLARALMDYLEEVTVKRHDGYFVDLFVRPSNEVAINMYKNLGYIVYRTVLGYYSGGADTDTEDAYDMRKAMPKDKDKVTVIPLEKPIHPHEDQIIYKLKNAIEDNKLQQFELECNENITQIDTFIKKLCKNNYLEFLQSLSSVFHFKEGLKTIKKEMTQINQNIQSIDKDFFTKAQKSIEVKSNYLNASESIRQFQQIKRVVERAKKIESLIERDILSVAFHEIDNLKADAEDAKLPPKIRDWVEKRVLYLEEKIFKLLQKMKYQIVLDLENQEIEAGNQVLDDVKRFVKVLGKQFMLDSDQDNRELTNQGQTMYAKNQNFGNNAAAQYLNMKRSQVGMSFYKSGVGGLNLRASKQGNNMLMTSINNMMRISRFGHIGGGNGGAANLGGPSGIVPKFQDRGSLAQIAFSRIGNLPKYDNPKNKESPAQFQMSQVMSPGSMVVDTDQILNRGQTMYTLDAIQKQAVVAQDITIDLDFSKIDNSRKLFQHIDQEEKFIQFLQSERVQRILKLSKLPRKVNIEENLTRMLGFFVVQIHLTFNLPQIFYPSTLSNYWDQCLLQLQKSLEQIVIDYDYEPIIQTKREIVNFILAVRDLGLIQDLSFLNTLIKLHDVFIDKLLTSVEKKVGEILEYENYEPIIVNNSEELFKYVDKYEIDLSKYFGMNQHVNLSYPVNLPYSLSVVKFNDILQHFLEENFQYWQFLLQDKADFTLAYSSCDRILIRTIELISEHFFHKNKFSILQRAQFCSNLEYILKSFGFFKKIVYQQANQGAYNFNQDIYGFSFTSENIMLQFKLKCEESIFTELRQKISDFLSILEGLQWRPKKPENTHHEFVEDLVMFLRSTIVNLDQQNKELAKQCYLTTFQHLSARVTEVLANSKAITHISQSGLINLYQDYLYLMKFSKEQMVNNQQMFEIGMGELQQVINLFLQSNPDMGVKEILDDDLYRKKYSKINLRKLVLILEKFRDDKVVVGQTNNPEVEELIQRLPKIKKSDAQSVAKKLRESLNFQK